MKSSSVFLSIILVICFLIHLTAGAQPKVVTYPAPEGAALSDMYLVEAAGQKVDTYAARVLDPPFAGKYDFGGNYTFANFDMTGPVVIRIKSARALDKVIVRPTSLGIQPSIIDTHTITITLNEPRKISIEPDGKKSPLLLFANPLETTIPSADDPNVLYFGPGVHNIDGMIKPKAGQTVYLAGGAVVKGGIEIAADNVKVRGRGILDGTKWEWQKGPLSNMISVHDARQAEIEGITICGSPKWTICLRNSDGVTIRNLKLCNSRVQNDDGINPCNTRNVLITDCFIRSDDDCVALKGLDTNTLNVENITVENSTLWCDRARIFLLGHESRAPYMRNITFRNLDIIHFTMTPFLLEPGEEMRLENITVEDIRIHGEKQQSLIRLRPVVNQYMKTQVPGFIRDVQFKNIRLFGKPGEYLVELMGADEVHTTTDVQFHNVSLEGKPLDIKSKNVRIGKNATGIEFYRQ